MCERILAQNCQKFDNFNLEFSMSHHNARYQSYKNAPIAALLHKCKLLFLAQNCRWWPNVGPLSPVAIFSRYQGKKAPWEKVKYLGAVHK